MIPVLAALAALTAPSDVPEPAAPTVIEDVRIETGDGRVIEHAHIVIADGLDRALRRDTREHDRERSRVRWSGEYRLLSDLSTRPDTRASARWSLPQGVRLTAPGPMLFAPHARRKASETLRA